MSRKTINRPISLEGTGLHKGRHVQISFIPADFSTGIRFIKINLPEQMIVNASIENVQTTQRGTNIGNGKEVIYTVEHVLSACAGLDIDDLDVELNEVEPPAMDGSALPFAEAFLKTGIKIKNNSRKNFLTCEKEFKVEFGDAKYHVKPYNEVFVRMVYKNEHKLVGTQVTEFEFNPENYVSQIAPARTFGFISEIEQLRARGLALGGSLDNAVVIDKDGFLTSSGSLRFDNEFARHKLLDLLGDLKLTGASFKNIWIEAISTSHSTNIDFAKLLQCRGSSPSGGLLNPHD